jgi:hypothetical protein
VARVLSTVVLLASTLWLVPGLPAAQAADALPTTLTLTAQAAYAGRASPLTVTLTQAGAPVADQEVLLERRDGGAWTSLATLTTDAAGVASTGAVLSRVPDNNLFRASYAGNAAYAPSATAAVQAALVKRTTYVRISGPSRIVDETSVRLSVTRRTGSGEPVPGPARIYRYRGGSWSLVAHVVLDARGSASWLVGARVDTAWRVRGAELPWAKTDASPVHRLDNVPPVAPVVLPADAPRPRITLPKQRRAVGAGPNARVSRIPDGVWRNMVGRSWHRGCPVGRSGLRLIRINYWGFDGYRRRGELVVNAGATGQFVNAFRTLYRERLPVRSMYRVDRFGWSSRLNGADDYKSMAADNTSAFNCRSVVNNPGVRSPHSYGRAVDINPWENPYDSRTGPVPNGWWMSRSHPRVAWRSTSHPVVVAMRDAGFSWTYGNGDSQHFDARTSSGRVVARCATTACD